MLWLCFGFILLVGCSEPKEEVREAYSLPTDVDIAKCEVGKYGGVFVYTVISEPITFNPIVSTDASTSWSIGMFLSGLVGTNAITQEHIPGLAKSWELGLDKKSYIFHLRRGVHWSDGAPFTADDVIFTFDALKDERYSSRYKQQYTIGGKYIQYEKLDDYTVRFRTAVPYAPFINNIGFIGILPKHKLYHAYQNGTLTQVWSQETAISNPEELVGTGPFRVRSFSPGERIIYERNPHYWRVDKSGQRLPYIDYVIQKVVSDTNTAVILFATGQTDAIELGGTNLGWLKDAAKTYHFKIYKQGPTPSLTFLWFNQKEGINNDGEFYVAPHKLKWFQDVRFRQAIQYAINREGIINGPFLGQAEPLDSIISHGDKQWYYAGVRRYRYNPEKARELLTEAGFYYNKETSQLFDGEGNPVKFELLMSEGVGQTWSSTMTSMQEDMKHIGIEMNISYVDFSTLILKINNLYQYEGACMAFSGGGDPSGGEAIYRSDGRLHLWNPNQPQPATAWEERIDQLMDQQEKEFDPAKRLAIIEEIQLIFSEQVPLILLVAPIIYQGVQDGWKNVQVPPMRAIIWNLDEWWKQ